MIFNIIQHDRSHKHEKIIGTFFTLALLLSLTTCQGTSKSGGTEDTSADEVQEPIEVSLGGETYFSDETSLYLCNLGLTNDNIQELDAFQNLTELDMTDTPISDLSPLYGLINLAYLYLENTPVTESQISKL